MWQQLFWYRMSQSKLESLQANIDELKAQRAMLERQLAKAQEDKDKAGKWYCQERLSTSVEHLAGTESHPLEIEEYLAEEQKWEKQMLLLRAQAAIWLQLTNVDIFCQMCIPLQFLGNCTSSCSSPECHQSLDVVASEAGASCVSVMLH